MSRFHYLVVDARYAGAPKSGLILAEPEEGLTRLDRWETCKINRIDALDLPASGNLLIPLKWFGVAQWGRTWPSPRWNMPSSTSTRSCARSR